MEVTNALLVALMFITLLSMGIGNIVAGLTNILDPKAGFKRYWVYTSWVFMLLLVQFELFWNTLDIFSIEEWTFRGFLYVVLGPILTYFATGELLPDSASAGSKDLRETYFGASPRFFRTFALLQGWMIGMDFVLGYGLSGQVILNAIACGLVLTLSFSQSSRVHSAGTVMAGMLFVVGFGARGLALI